MLHAGLDLSRSRIDVCLLSDAGEVVEEFKSPADRDGLAGLVRRVDRHRQPVRAVHLRSRRTTAAFGIQGPNPDVRPRGSSAEEIVGALNELALRHGRHV